MSMAMALSVRDFLRKENGWDVNRCDIQQGGTVPDIARQFYVTLDDAGVQTGPAENYYLKEILSIEVGIWVETGHIPADMSGHAQLKNDDYIKGTVTLDDMERAIIAQLHHREEPRNQINEQFGLPGDDGDIFLLNFVYGGRPRNEIQGVFQNQNRVGQWLGRRLRFGGLTRNQKIGCVK